MGLDKQIFIDGQFVSERIAQVVNAIREYSPEIDVEWCPPHQRRPGQAAFKVMHKPLDGREGYTIFHVKTEAEFDARVLKRLMAGDQRSGELKYTEVEAAEEAAKRVAHQRWMDEMEEANEMAAAIMKSPKDTYKINDNLIFKSTVEGSVSQPKPRYLK